MTDYQTDEAQDLEWRAAEARAYRWVADDIEVGGIDWAHYPALLRRKATSLLTTRLMTTEDGEPT